MGNGDQFVCLNLNNPEERNGSTPTYTLSSDQGQTYTSLSDTYVTNPDLQQQLQTGQAFLSAPGVTTVHRAMGVVQAPVHSQLVIQRVGTLPRQYAHPLAPQ